MVKLGGAADRAVAAGGRHDSGEDCRSAAAVATSVRVDIAHPYRQRTSKVTREQLHERAAAIGPRVEALEATASGKR
jgi:hypothetical protein